MSEFERSKTTRTRTHRVSDTGIAASFEESLENAIEGAESALLFIEVMKPEDGAAGLERFEALAALALRGLSICQQAKARAEADSLSQEFTRENTATGALPLPDAADFLGIPHSELFLLLEDGSFETVYDGEIKIEVQKLEAFKAQHAAPTTGDPDVDGDAVPDASPRRFDDICDLLFESELQSPSDVMLDGSDSTDEHHRAGLESLFSKGDKDR